MEAFVFVTLTWTRTTERQCEGKGQTKASRWDLDQNTYSVVTERNVVACLHFPFRLCHSVSADYFHNTALLRANILHGSK